MMLDTTVGVFVWLLGLCVGSFLNVVVYRLPRGLSIRRPSRSFCPQCRATIAWYDNIPVLSWLLLRARCRHCGQPISMQYPLVEATTGLTFVLVYHLLFSAGARAGLPPLEHVRDWPLLLSWLILVASLVACAAMDVTSYMVDVRLTCVPIGAGIILHAMWPHGFSAPPLLGLPVTAAAAAAFILSLVMLWLTVWRVPDTEPGFAPPPAEEPKHSTKEPRAALGVLAVVVLIGLTGWLLAETALHGRGDQPPHWGRPTDRAERYAMANARAARADAASRLAAPAALALIFATLVLAAALPRATDREVHAAIEDEQPQARRLALRELLWLAPVLIAAAAVYVGVSEIPALKAAWAAATGWSWAGLCPAGGAAWAMLGAMAGAGAGWTLRILFTLVFGREAMGVGDIYILAAAGATAGWDIALAGLPLGVGLAIVGYAISLLLKRTVVIPFGPWLAIGFVAALWLSSPITRLARRDYENAVLTWSERPDICLVAAGLLLVGSGLAIVLARLTRRAVEGRRP